MAITNIVQSVSNFLVPAYGTTNAYPIIANFPAIANAGTLVDFAQIGINGLPFRPSGVLIDNTKGTVAAVVLINEIGFTMQCPAGKFMTMPYPAPLDCTATVWGDPTQPTTVVFVYYPVMPFVSP